MINIKSDSRKVKPGDIFVALDGISSNGSEYIASAIKNGASKIVAHSGSYEVETVIVPDTRKYLNEYLVNNYNDILNEMNIIGITGTNGKTTTAFLVYEALNLLNKKCAYIGTIGYYLDKKVANLPNTSPDICEIYDMVINAYDNGFKTVIIEVSSQGLAYNRFEGLLFDYALFTNLTQDHLDFHKTMENYALTKQKLFNKLKTNGKRFINIDDKYCDYFKIDNYQTYGFNESDYQVVDYKLNPNGSLIKIKNDNEIITINSPLLGKYNIYNILCTYILLKQLNYSNEQIIDIIPKLKSPDGRMDIIKYKNNTIIIDYAHTPDAMENIINTVKEVCKGNIYIVFGCTGDRDRLKRPVMLNMATKNVKFVIVTSDDLHNEEFSHIVNDMTDGVENKNYTICQDRRLAIKQGIDLLKEQDMLLILGKGHETGIIIKDKKIPFNDKKVVEELLNNEVMV